MRLQFQLRISTRIKSHFHNRTQTKITTSHSNPNSPMGGYSFIFKIVRTRHNSRSVANINIQLHSPCEVAQLFDLYLNYDRIELLLSGYHHLKLKYVFGIIFGGNFDMVPQLQRIDIV